MAVNTFKLEFEDGVTKTLEVVVVSPTDIIMFVAGTQDPVNIAALKHQANHNYWKDSKDNLWGNVKKLKPQFHDLNIEADFFSWSGDNSEDERNKAADRLLDLFTREYPKFKNKETHLHLIGHSHGGNVINQFTELITTDSRFPKLWEIKSITYLSTPFFREKHQLNHSKLHKDCQIINVHNDYDITQRFVADFSLDNLENLIAGFNSFEFDKAKQRIGLILSSGVFAPITSATSIISDSTQGVLIWERVSLLLDNVNQILDLIINMVNNPKLKKLSSEKAEINQLLTELKAWIPIAQTNLNTRVTEYQQTIENINSSSEEEGLWGKFKDNLGKAADSISNSFSDTFETVDLMSDLHMEAPLRVINKILFIDKGLEDAYLLGLLERIFSEQSGVTDTIDNTTWDPTEQVQGKFKVTDVPITNEDAYHSRGLKSKFEQFVSGAEKSIADGNLKEFLIRLVSQLISSASINDMSTILWWADLIFKDDADDEFKKFRKDYLPKYSQLIEKYEAHLIAPQDKPIEEKTKTDTETPDAFTEAAKLEFTTELNAINSITKQNWEATILEAKEKKREDEEKNPPAPPVIGSLAHFATVSHGLSHTKLWDEVEQELKNSFSSGKNPGYKE
ncbi:hypothetical protein [Psychroserpens sp. NJDZ02]|uniref:hypothetical protein n=1 Tax=Psychroserpens sp. NJDZ02 TaxID=2570561 RepID=UPI0010A77D8A|nr:hypothetical protein [Psychroserpens sp. NJDZ02]QCE41816.1 hypothetical protein E9099_10480 [Psychroserpens sp. NJDZ02]